MSNMSRVLPFSEEDIIGKFEELILDSGFDSVECDDAEILDDGTVVVDFSDDEGDDVSILFGVDDKGSYAMVVSEGDDKIMVDLSPKSPPTVVTEWGSYIDFRNDPEWITKSTLRALFSAGDVGTDLKNKLNYDKMKRLSPDYPDQPLKGEEIEESVMDFDELNEVAYKKVKVVRKGKVVVRKIPIIKMRKKMSQAQKQALKKAIRKSKTSTAKMKRKRSNKLRKQRLKNKQQFSYSKQVKKGRKNIIPGSKREGFDTVADKLLSKIHEIAEKQYIEDDRVLGLTWLILGGKDDVRVAGKSGKNVVEVHWEDDYEDGINIKKLEDYLKKKFSIKVNPKVMKEFVSKL